jgi:aspartate/methionine/tyrosine aminotransferase
MTGWRRGWLVVPEGTRDSITGLVEVTHSGVAPFIQRAGVAAVHDTDTVEQFRAHCLMGRKLTGDALSYLNGVRYAAPDGAFYAFVGVEGLTDSLTLAKSLAINHRVAVAPGIAFGEAGEAICAYASLNRPRGSNARWVDCATDCREAALSNA